jgi:DNA-binding NtrC family response regulator
MEQPTLVVFEPADSLQRAICKPLTSLNVRVRRVAEKSSLLALNGECHLVVLGPSVVEMGSLLNFGSLIRFTFPHVRMLAIASSSSEELLLAALRSGFSEYVKYPFTEDELRRAVQSCLPHSNGREGMKAASEAAHSPQLIGDSEATREVRDRLARLALYDSHILITGETGTGKELVAGLIHRNSPRRNRPFITLNCAAIPENLLESELFGYERGAFTGAQDRNEGKLKTADGGSVLLDEIGDMSLCAQAKLLRMIEGNEIQRLGRNEGVSVNVRVIAATNQNLEQMVAQGEFRKDFFYRLNVARIHLAPLRERKEDLPALVSHYIRHFNILFGRKVERLSDDAMHSLLAYDWPGNVRELRNVLEGVFVELPPGEVTYPHLPATLRLRYERINEVSSDERDRLLWALSVTNWNKSKAASKLHWSRMTLYRKMARYNIS